MSPDLLEQCVAEMMHDELEGSRLDVYLVPSSVEYQPTQRMRRVVMSRNPDWYRCLCRDYVSNRSRPRQKSHGDTAIKRQHTLRALREISSGRLETKYAHLVYELVKEEAIKMQAVYGNGLTRETT